MFGQETFVERVDRRRTDAARGGGRLRVSRSWRGGGSTPRCVRPSPGNSAMNAPLSRRSIVGRDPAPAGETMIAQARKSRGCADRRRVSVRSTGDEADRFRRRSDESTCPSRLVLDAELQLLRFPLPGRTDTFSSTTCRIPPFSSRLATILVPYALYPREDSARESRDLVVAFDLDNGGHAFDCIGAGRHHRPDSPRNEST